jgi:hypothetical protein
VYETGRGFKSRKADPMITQLDIVGVLALIILPPVVIFVYLLAWGLYEVTHAKDIP